MPNPDPDTFNSDRNSLIAVNLVIGVARCLHSVRSGLRTKFGCSFEPGSHMGVGANLLLWQNQDLLHWSAGAKCVGRNPDRLNARTCAHAVVIQIYLVYFSHADHFA